MFRKSINQGLKSGSVYKLQLPFFWLRSGSDNITSSTQVADKCDTNSILYYELKIEA